VGRRLRKTIQMKARLEILLMVVALALVAACQKPAVSAPSATPGDGVIRSEEATFKVVTVADGLEHPWSLAFVSKNEMLVTERSGRLRRIRDGLLQDQPLTGVPKVHAAGQGGLMEVLLHPKFAENRLVYLSYSKPGPRGNTTAVCRGKLGDKGLEQVKEIFEADAWSKSNAHFGGRMLFDDKGCLVLTVGERASMERAQNFMDHAGCTIRLNDDGTVPADNPFVGRQGYRAELYTVGNRNAQGMVVHPETRQIWQHEHGPMGGDELNLIQAGANYGWPLVTYGLNYNGSVISEKTEMEGMVSPVLHWVPSIACSGLVVYTGDAFPKWKGNFFVGALVQAHLRRVVMENGKPVHQEMLLKELRSRIRTVAQGPDGLLYVLTDSPQGGVFRLEPAS